MTTAVGLALGVAMLTTPPGDASAPAHLGAAPPGAATAPSGVPLPTLARPPAGVHGHPLWDSWHELDSFGYRQDEYLVSGTARALDGSTAPYTTRIIVFRPREESRSNGTVLLDWVNVTAQFENAVDTLEGLSLIHI